MYIGLTKEQEQLRHEVRDYFDQLHAERLKRHLVKRLESLGVSVTLQPQAG